MNVCRYIVMLIITAIYPVISLSSGLDGVKQASMTQSISPLDVVLGSHSNIVVMGNIDVSYATEVSPLPQAATCVNPQGACTAKVTCPNANQKFAFGGYGFFILPSHSSKTGALDGNLCGVGHITCNAGNSTCSVTSQLSSQPHCDTPDWLHQIVVVHASCVNTVTSKEHRS